MIIGEWCRRLGYLVRRRRVDDDLRREMESHRAMLDDPRAFGNTLRLREQARDAWGWTWLDDFVHDLRLGVRTLRRSPGFASAAIVTLALGIGVNVGMFRLVDALLLRPLVNRSGVVELFSRATTPEGGVRGLSYPDYLDLRAATADTFAGLAAVHITFVGFDSGEGSRRTLAAAVTSDYFQVVGVPLAMGRTFTREEETLGSRAHVAIVSHRFWERRGSDPSVLGRVVHMSGIPFTIVGVAAKGFSGTGIPGPEVWMPMGADIPNTRLQDGGLAARDVHQLGVIGRLRDGVSMASATPAIDTVSRQLAHALPDLNDGYALALGTPSRLMFMPGSGGGVMTTLAVILMAMPLTVLLVACLNLANLLLARGQSRRHEMAIRSSLGAGRGRLSRQLLSEGLLLAFASGIVAIVLSTWATRSILASIDPLLPVAVDLPSLDADWRVFAATVVFSLLATLVFGAGPAWALASRAAASDLKRRALEQGWQRRRGLRIGNLLVTAQVALSLVLLASGGLFLMSAVTAATADPGFRLEGGLVAEIDPELAGYDDDDAFAIYRSLVDRLRQVPGIDAVTVASRPPFRGAGESRRVVPAGAGATAQGVDAAYSIVDRDYARTLGLQILKGRDFNDAELLPGSSAPVAMVDDELARELWPGEEVLGRSIAFARGETTGPAMQIVGVVPAVKHSLGNPHLYPHVYVPIGHADESAMTVQIRVAGGRDERAMLPTVAQVIKAVDPGLPVVRLQTWRDHLDGSLEIWLYRTGAKVFASFGAIALLLAVVGVYGVKSYVVSQRTREFGIRIATGAHPRVLLWQVLREGGLMTAVGVAIGLVLALAVGQFLQGLLYGIRAVEPVVLMAGPVILLTASLLASLMPALAATRVDPAVALRAE